VVQDVCSRPRTEERDLRRQLLATWLAHMKSGQQILLNKDDQLEKLIVDDRPLDRLAVRDGQLVENMTDIRRRILARNRKIELYDAVLGPQLKYLVMATPPAPSIPVQQLQSGETDIAVGLKQWRDDYLAQLDSERIPLLHSVEQLTKSLDKALAQEEAG
jgi:hypothetical protein